MYVLSSSVNFRIDHNHPLVFTFVAALSWYLIYKRFVISNGLFLHACNIFVINPMKRF